jgi:hypothetical protein
MKTSNKLFICALVGLLGLLPSAALGKRNPDAIQIITTFDFPGAVRTTSYGINDQSEVVGNFAGADSFSRGFIRYPDGIFDTVSLPGDTQPLSAFGINNSRVVVGGSGQSGFIKTGNIFTWYDFPGAIFTTILGNNDAGNLAGGFRISNFQAFVHINGTPTAVIIPGDLFSTATDINNQNVAVGWYAVGNDIAHGFIRNPNGALVYPFDYPGATATLPNGINDQGWIVGQYVDANGFHGFLFRPPNVFVPFDYPGAISTSLNGINNFGHITGSYIDADENQHGFLAVVTRHPLR